MKLIGAGLPRTGTLTQKVALEMLGLAPCYHMVTVLGDLDQAGLWMRALDRDGIAWSDIFDGYPSTIDWPGGYFYRELMDAYPDAKVLLSVRDPESWEKSMRETVWAVRNGGSLMHLLSDAWGKIDPHWAAFLHMLDALLWTGKGTFACGHSEPGQLAEAMERHDEEVRRAVPADRLLEWSVGEGWEPLCEFLEAPVPEDSFPHVNDSAEFVKRIVDGSLAAISRWRDSQPAGLTADAVAPAAA